MRILVIHTVYKLQGGEDIVVANEIALLRSLGHIVDLLQFNNSGHTLAKLAQLPFNFSSFSSTKKKILAFKPDVAHIHNLHFAGSASVIYALKKYQIPVVLTLHNYRLLCPSATLFYNGQLFTTSITEDFNWEAVRKGVYQHSKLITFWVSLSMWLHQKLGTWKYPAAYIALGDFTVDIFKDSKLREIAARTIVKPNFCYPPGIAMDAKINRSFVYVGRLSEEKGIGLLLAAFSANKLPLTIAGTGPMEPEVRRFAAQYPNIIYMGQVDKLTVDKLISSARALIFPSQWYETFGMVIIEAFSFGTPVLASGIGQLKYTISENINGLHFKTGDVKDLMEKVDLLDRMNDTDYAALRKNAYQSYITTYAPEQNARQLELIYDHIKRSALTYPANSAP
jgi:glycosyltransferase involved in cell wall biosynthesis